MTNTLSRDAEGQYSWPEPKPVNNKVVALVAGIVVLAVALVITIVVTLGGGGVHTASVRSAAWNQGYTWGQQNSITIASHYRSGGDPGGSPLTVNRNIVIPNVSWGPTPEPGTPQSDSNGGSAVSTPSEVTYNTEVCNAAADGSGQTWITGCVAGASAGGNNNA